MFCIDGNYLSLILCFGEDVMSKVPVVMNIYGSSYWV